MFVLCFNHFFPQREIGSETLVNDLKIRDPSITKYSQFLVNAKTTILLTTF